MKMSWNAITDLNKKEIRRLITEETETGILLKDKNGKILLANSKLAELLRSTTDELCSFKNIENLWNTKWKITTEKGDPIHYEESAFHRTLHTGKAHSQTILVNFKNGDTQWMLVYSEPLFVNNEEGPFSVVSSFYDLTPHQKAILTSNEGELLLHSFFNQSSGLAWIFDEFAALKYANTAFYQYFNIEGSRLNQKAETFLPKEIVGLFYEKHLSVLDTGKSIETVEKIKLVDGSSFLFYIHMFPVEVISGKRLTGGQAFKLNSNDETEKQLRETNERLLNLSRVAANAIWELDIKTGKVFRNEPLLDMIGYPIEEVTGLNWWLSRIHPEDLPGLIEKIDDPVKKNQKSWEHEYRFKLSDDSYTHVRDRGFILYEDGQPAKMIGSLLDISEIKQLENKLLDSKLKHHEEIAESIISAQEKERIMIGQELHDNVNQILTTAKLYLEMMQRGDEDREMLATKTKGFIVTAINEVTAISRNMVLPKLKDKNLVDGIRELLDDIKATGLFKVEFGFEENFNLYVPEGKRITLYRIVQEQLKNIIKHSNAKKIKVDLKLGESSITLLVQDDGVGFDASQQKRGIGLSNIHDRARLYNGSVALKTSPGNGCSLQVTIPVN